MNKLEKLEILKYKTLTAPQMKLIAGGYGGSGTYEDPYQIQAVYVTGCYCPLCIEFNKQFNPLGLQGGDKWNNISVTPLYEWVVKEFGSHAPCCPWHD